MTGPRTNRDPVGVTVRVTVRVSMGIAAGRTIGMGVGWCGGPVIAIPTELIAGRERV